MLHGKCTKCFSSFLPGFGEAIQKKVLENECIFIRQKERDVEWSIL